MYFNKGLKIMYEITNKSIFNVDAQVIVNAVNTVGIMSAGIALEFKLRFPDMYKDYYDRCAKGQVELGKPYLYGNVLNFPTKDHWKTPSKTEWIDQGLHHFVRNYKNLGIKSIAFPKLGCGRGGLDWIKIQKMMIYYFEPLQDIDIKICLDTAEPEGLERKMMDFVMSRNPELHFERFRDLRFILNDKIAYEQVFNKAFEKAINI
jgi:O-acetyl-ADP-ribose deacetylase (regulator of RNase III)